MITGRWGKPSEVLLDLVVDEDGAVRGVANPGRQNAPIRRGHFDPISGVVNLEGEHVRSDGTTLPFRIAGRLDGRTPGFYEPEMRTTMTQFLRRRR